MKFFKLFFAMFSFFLLYLTACNDKNLQTLNEPALSAAANQEALGFTVSIEARKGSNPDLTQRYTITTATIWDGISEFKANTVYKLTMDQARQLWANDPEQLAFLDEISGIIPEDSNKRKDLNEGNSGPMLAEHKEQNGLTVDATVDTWSDGYCHCVADLYTESDLESGMNHHFHTVYNVTYSSYVFLWTWDIEGRSWWQSHVTNDVMNHSVLIRAQARIRNDGISFTLSAQEQSYCP